MVRTLMRGAASLLLVLPMLVLCTCVASADHIDDAIAGGVANAAQQGITSYISVVDRATGEVVGETANAHRQVASESIMKLFIAGDYAVDAGGFNRLLPARRSQLERTVILSDDATASSLFAASIVPDQAARYGLAETGNASPPGHWGAARITAHDMATYLYRMANDALVGPWLLSVMAAVAPNGSDGFNQYFGFNALSGEHGSKQGWGNDSWISGQPNAIHSVGYTDRWFAAVLQTGGAGTYYPMRTTATVSAQLIQAAATNSEPRGTVDAVSLRGSTVTVTGWAFDTDDPAAALEVDIYDSGPQGTVGRRVRADQPRPDVTAAFGAPGGHGFASTFAVAGAGPHQVCAYAINIGAGDRNPVLGCSVVYVSDDPFGVVDSLSVDSFTASVAGWTLDPNALLQPLVIHVYDTRSDGSSAGQVFNSGQSRSDVAAAYPGATDRAGFAPRLRLTGGGLHRVCAYAINIGLGANALVGCGVVATPAPVGSVDTVSVAAGQVTVRGWSLDLDQPTMPLVNHVYVTAANGSVRGYTGFVGNQSRIDVGAAFPGAGDRHGFAATVPIGAGSNTVCVYAISARPPQLNPLIGCRTVVG